MLFLTAHAPRGFPRGLHGWQEETNQDSDDGNNDQELYQRKGASTFKSMTHDNGPNIKNEL